MCSMMIGRAKAMMVRLECGLDSIYHSGKTHFQQRNTLMVSLILGVIIGISYFPVVFAYFISDDFQYLSFMLFNAQKMLNGQLWDAWLLGGIDGYLYFRPIGHALMFLDFLMWGSSARGYHLTNLLLHWLVSFMLYLTCYLLTRRQGLSLCSAMLFAVMPVHSEAVSWIAARYDVIAGLFCLTSLTFVILARRYNALRFYVFSLVAFMAAVSSKETALPFAAILLLYEVLFNPQYLRTPLVVAKYHLGYWMIILGRLVFFGHGYGGVAVNVEKALYWLDATLSRLVLPIADEISPGSRWFLVFTVLLVCLIFFSKRHILFGVAWIPLMAVATLASGSSDRSFYLPSVGLALVLGGVLAQGMYSPNRALRVIGLLALVSIIGTYTLNLYTRNQDIYRAGQTTEAIPAQVQHLYPVLPAEARLVFVGVPDYTARGTLVYITGFPNSLQITYRNPTLSILKANKFPLWLNGTEQILYFQVDHRRVIERADLIRVLRKRAQCEEYSAPLLTWDSEGLNKWELWNQLSESAIRDGGLVVRSEGTDPIMASPPIEIPAIAIGEIQITMRVRAAQSILGGELHWLASGQTDFSPGLKSAFRVIADETWRTYHVDIAKSGMLLMGDHITQLRFDPVDAPAEIAIRSITIFTRCSSLQGDWCICALQ